MSNYEDGIFKFYKTLICCGVTLVLVVGIGLGLLIAHFIHR